MIDYREKYLKYKKKYLQAKNIYGGRLVRTASGLRQFDTQEGFSEVSYKDQIRALEKERVEEAMYEPLPEVSYRDQIRALEGERVEEAMYEPLPEEENDGNAVIELRVQIDGVEGTIRVSPTQRVSNREFWIRLIDEWGFDKNKYYDLRFGEDILYTFGPDGQQGTTDTYDDFGIEDGGRVSLQEVENVEALGVTVTSHRTYEDEVITIYYPISIPLKAEIFMNLLKDAINERYDDDYKWKEFINNANWGDIYFTDDDDIDESGIYLCDLERDMYWSEGQNFILYEGLRRTRG